MHKLRIPPIAARLVGSGVARVDPQSRGDGMICF